MSNPIPSGKQLFVGNLPYSVQWQDLKDLFREAGTVIRADVMMGPDGRSRGFGTVILSTEEESTNAINTLNNFEWQGRKLEVREDRGPPSREDRGGFRNSPSQSYHGSTSGEGSRALYVGNLPFSVGWQDLKDFFRQAGNVQRAEVPVDYQGRSKGYGTVVMSSVTEANKAVAQFNGHEWNGRTIEVREDLNFRDHAEPQFRRQEQSHYHSQPQRHVGGNVAGRALYVGNLPFTVQWQELKDMFRQAGTVQRADIVMDGQGRSRGYGQVLMSAAEEAQKGIEMFNGTDVQGRMIEVRLDKFAESDAQNAGCQVYVGNLPYSTRWQELKDIFRPYDLNPIHADVITEPSGRSKGFGIVRFATKEDGERAVNEVNGLAVANRNIIVRLDKFSG